MLDLAGITQWVPACRFEWKPVHGEPDPDTGEIPTKWVIDDLVEYVATCPMWAWKLARNLTRDRDLARRLGYVQTRKLVKLVTSKGKVDQEWAACNKAKSVPIEVRAAIIRAAAVSEMARTMIEDDPEAAALILRGAMT